MTVTPVSPAERQVDATRGERTRSAILQANCVRCHDALAHEIAFGRTGEVDGLACVHCHFGVGHGERTGIGPPLHYDAETNAALLNPASQQKH